MTYIRQSLRTANHHIIYVPFLALGGLIVWTDSTQLYNLLSVVIAFTLYPIVYGSIVEKIESDKSSSWTDLLSKHFGNYFLLTIITIIPVMALSYLYSDLDFVEETTSKALVGAIIQIATVYIWPLVFINVRVLKSIPQGLSALRRRGWRNIPLILLILFTALVKVLAINSLIFQSRDILLVYGMGYLQNLTNAYIDLIVFSLAASILLTKNSGTQSSQFCKRKE